MDQTIQKQLPGWTLEDAYGTVQDKRFQDELQKIHCEIKKLRDLLPTNPTKENVLQCLPIYEDAVEGISSLISFSYCASSADITDSAAAAAYAQTQALYAELESIASPLFAKLGSIADNDPFWENSIVSHWQFNAREKNKSWRQGLDSATNEIINKFAATSFYPVDAMYKRLNKSMRVQAQNSQGEILHLTHSQCVGVLKGADDPVLRETAQLAVNDWYKKQAGYYVDLLNLLHGFRKVQFSLAGLSDWMQPSLEQNRISKEALQAALGAIKHRQPQIQQAITVRAPFFGRSFQMTVTATGRLSSTEPNLQNIPTRTPLGSELRRMFVPERGNVLVDADYSQIELRLLAHIAGDETMRQAFLSGEDIHTVTASQVFGVPTEAVTKQMRSHAKAVNFGIVYGISAFSLAQDIGVSVYEAKEYIQNYLDRFSGVRRYMTEIVERAKAQGYVETLMHRRRDLPELTASNFATRSFGERVALNMPIQGTAADVMKLAMVCVHDRLRREAPEAKLLLQVHDELIVECPEELAERVARLLTEEMEGVMSLSVPLVAEAHWGKNWLEAKG